MNWPKVSFVTATYNRPPNYLHLLEECVESFRRNAEDYPGECELLLLSDCPGQRLECDTPGVRIVHLEPRFTSLGEKLNTAISLATGEIILPQDDDDISLPWRARQAAKRLGEDKDYFCPGQYWYLEEGRGLFWDHAKGWSHNCSGFRKSAWFKCGGYPLVSGSQDRELHLRLLKMRCAAPLTEHRAEWSYIYRWGVSPVHLSGTYPHDDYWRRVGEMPVAKGVFAIRPRWLQDYVVLTDTARLVVGTWGSGTE